MACKFEVLKNVIAIHFLFLFIGEGNIIYIITVRLIEEEPLLLLKLYKTRENTP